MNTLYLILSALGGGGLGVAIVSAWSKIKLKQLDVFVEERQQFIKEVTDLRKQMNELYTQHYQLMGENSALKYKIKDLEDHVNKKSDALKDLTALKGYHKRIKEVLDLEISPNDFIERVKILTDSVLSN